MDHRSKCKTQTYKSKEKIEKFGEWKGFTKYTEKISV